MWYLELSSVKIQKMKSYNERDVNIMLAVYIIVVLALCFLSSCNPYKYILKDKARTDKMAEVVVGLGYCANDTVILHSVDTFLVIDTVMEMDTLIEVMNDTTYITKTIRKDITHFKTIVDTIKSVVIDSSLTRNLRSENGKLSARLSEQRMLTKKLYGYIAIAIVIVVIFVVTKIRSWLIR